MTTNWPLPKFLNDLRFVLLRAVFATPERVSSRRRRDPLRVCHILCHWMSLQVSSQKGARTPTVITPCPPRVSTGKVDQPTARQGPRA